MNKTNLEGRHDKGSIPDSGRKGKRGKDAGNNGVCVCVGGGGVGVGGVGWDTLAQTSSTGLRHPSFNYCRI